MGRDRKEAILIVGLILCTLAQIALTLWSFREAAFAANGINSGASAAASYKPSSPHDDAARNRHRLE